ncbi:MAG: hypothetical protein JWP10_19 [Nocardioidaceae bacterium]|nr:hypothetical protein [Nocardioidaceae bacterium]
MCTIETQKRQLHTDGDFMEYLTVTIFGDGKNADQALARELSRHGARTHIVTSLTGWLPSAQLAVVRSDTPAGRAAAESIDASAAIDAVITCEFDADVPLRPTVDGLTASRGRGRHISLVRHPHIDQDLVDESPADLDSIDEISAEQFAHVVVAELQTLADIA